MLNPNSLSRFTVGSVMLVLAALTAALLPSNGLHAEKGGNGKGGNQDPPPPAPVYYWLDRPGTFGGLESEALGMNDNGVVVGMATDADESERGYRVIPDLVDGNRIYWTDSDSDGINDLLEDLNELVTVWTDEAGIPLADQQAWTVVSARDVNAFGEIVGQAEHNDTGERSAFFFDPVTAQIFVLPSVGAGDHRGVKINDLGEIVADRIDAGYWVLVYRWNGQAFEGKDLGITSNSRAFINNAGVIVAGGHRLTPDGDMYSVEYFDYLALLGINDSGTIAGVSDGVKERGKWVQPSGVFRSSQDDADGNPILEILSGLTFVVRINSSGDEFIRDGLRGAVYTDEHGLLQLDDLVVNQDTDWVNATWVNGNAINSRDVTGFGQICGYTAHSGEPREAFVLTPFVPVP